MRRLVRTVLVLVGSAPALLLCDGAMAQCSIDVDVDPSTSQMDFESEGVALAPNESMVVAGTLKTLSYGLFADEQGTMTSIKKLTYTVRSRQDSSVQRLITIEDVANAGLRFFVKTGDGSNVEVTETCTECPGKVPTEFYGRKVGPITAHKADGSTFTTGKFRMKVVD